MNATKGFQNGILLAAVLGFHLVMPQPPAMGQSGKDKALKYFEVLQKKPRPGYLFDQFYNVWLDADSIEGLEGFLTETVASEETTSNRLLLAFFYSRQGENVKALEQFGTALDKDPGSAVAWYQKALVEQRTLDFETALGDLTRALGAKPSPELERDILQLQGKLHARNGDADQAKEVWRQLLEKNPGDEHLQEDLIELQISEGLYSEALETAENLLAKTGDPYRAVLRRLRLGDIHQRAGDRDAALEAYASSLEKVGDDTWVEKEIFGQMEQVFRREDDIAGMESYFQALLDEHPRRIGLRRRHAKVLAELGKREEASKAFGEILALTPGDRAVREDFVRVLAKLEMRGQAMEQLSLLIGQHPEDGELLVKLANLQNEASQPEEARKTLESYLGRSDKSEHVYLRTARLLERFEQVEGADEVFQELLEAHPESEGARDSYAVYLHRQGRTEEAIAVWWKLAEGGRREQMVRVARALSSRNEREAAFGLLRSRFDDYRGDAIYLKELCAVAVKLEKFEEALPWALDLVKLVEDGSNLEAALAMAARVVERAGKEEEVKRQMAGASLPQEICLLAELYEHGGESEKAEAALARMEKDAPVLAAEQRVRLFRQRGEFDQAAKAAEALMELPGGRRTGNVRRIVKFYERAGMMAEALAWIPEWKKLSPGSTQPWVSEARLLGREGSWAEAIEVLRRATQEFEEKEEIRVTLARIYIEEGKLDDAHRIYMQLYEESEDLSSRMRWAGQLATVAKRQGKSSVLVEHFEERRRGNRMSIVPLLALAEIHRVEGDYEGRRQALLEAVRIRPGDLDLLLEVARIEESEADYEKALATLESALRTAKGEKQERVRERMARLHFAFGEEELGFRMLEEIAGGENVDPRRVEGLFQAMASTGDWSYAIEFIAPHLEEYPEDYRLAYLHAVALEEDGREEEALAAFARILGMRTELLQKGKSSPKANPFQSAYREGLRRFVPEAVFQLIRLKYSYLEMAYKHRLQPGHFGSGRGMQQSAIAMPIDLAAMHGYALAHLATMGRGFGVEDLGHVVQKMGDLGLGCGDFFFDIDFEEGLISPQLLEKHGKNEVVLVLMLVESMDHPVMRELALARTAFEAFEKSKPQLAYVAGILSGVSTSIGEGQKQEVDKLVWGALALADEFEDPSVFVLAATQEALGGESALDGAQKKELTDRLMAWYPAVVAKDPWLGYLVARSLSQALSEAENLEPLVEFLDSEVSMYQNKKQRAIFSSGGIQPLLAPMPFPPKKLTEFPRSVSRIVSGLRIDPEKLTEHIDKAKSPVLRVLLSARLREEDGGKTVKALLKQLTGEREAKLDWLLLAAAYAAAVEDDPKAAVTFLKRAQILPMARETRKSADAWMLATCLAAHPGGKADAGGFLAAGREAALRLRRTTLTPSERRELMEALDELGLDEESRRLEAKASASRTSGGVSLNPFGDFTPQRGNRIQKLLMEGNKQRALQLLAGDLKRFAQAGLSPKSFYNSRYEEQEWLEQIFGHNLRGELLEFVDPGESTSLWRLKQWAYACELLGETERAAELYAKILADRPKEAGVRFRLFMLKVFSDPEGLPNVMEGLDPAGMAMFGHWLEDLLMEEVISLERWVALLDSLVSLVGEIQDPSRTNLTWLPELLDELAGMTEVEGVEIGFLYRPRYAENDDIYRPGYAENDDIDDAQQKKRIEDLRRARREAHDRICRVMLGIPQLTREGFRRLVGLIEHEGMGEETTVELAKKALLDYAPPRAGVSTNDWSLRGFPEHFIVRHAWKGRNRSIIDDELLPELEKRSGREFQEIAKSMREHAELFFCEESEFLDVAKKLLEGSKVTKADLQPKEIAAANIADAWELRKLEVDLARVVLDEIRRTKFNSDFPATLFEKVLRAEVQAGGAAAAEAFLERLSETYLGPAEEREALIKKHYHQHRYRGGTANAGIHAYVDLVEVLGKSEDLYFHVATYFNEKIAPIIGRSNLVYFDLSPSDHPLLSYASYGDFSEATRLLDEVPTLSSNAEDFRFLFRGVRTEGSQSFFGGLVDQIRRQPLARAMRFSEHLMKKGHFGASLLAVAIDPSPPKVDGFLSQYTEDMKALPKERALQIIAYLRSRMPEDFDESRLSEAEKSWLDWSRRVWDRALDAEIDEMLAAKSHRDLDFELYEFEGKAERYLVSLLPARRARALELYGKAVALFDSGRRAGKWQGSHDSGTFQGNLLEDVLFELEEPEVLNFAYDVFAFPSRKFPAEFPSSRFLELSLHSVAAEAKKAKDGKTKGDIEVMQQVLADLHQTLDPSYVTYPVYAYYEMLRKLTGTDGKLSAAILPYLKEQAEKGEQQDLAKVIHAIATLREAHLSYDDPKPGDLGSPVALFTRRFEDESIPLPVRLNMAEALMYHSGEILPAELMAKAITLLDEAWAANLGVRDEMPQRLTRFILDVERSDVWRETMEKLLSSWKHHRLLKARSTRRIDQTMARRMVELCVLLEDYESMDLILGQSPGAMDGGVLPLLMRKAPAERIVPQLVEGWAGLDWRVGNPSAAAGAAMVYDDEIAAKLSSLVEIIEDSDLELLAETLVHSLPDAETGASAREDAGSGDPLSARDKRMVVMAERVREHDFGNVMVRDAILSFLVDSKPAGEIVQGLVREAAREITPMSYLRSFESILEAQREQRRRLFEFALAHSLGAGPEFASTALREMARIPVGYDYADELIRLFRDAVQSNAHHWPNDVRKENAAFWTTVIAVDDPQRVYWYRFNQWAGLGYAFTAAEGGDVAKGFASAFDKLSQEAKMHLKDDATFSESLVGAIGGAIKDRGLDAETRTALFHEIHDDEVFTASAAHSARDLLGKLVDAQLVTREELLEMGPDLIETFPRKGKAGGELAKLQEAAQQYEEAIVSYESALKALPETDDDRYSDFKFAIARLHQKLGRASRGLAVLKDLDKDRLSAGKKPAFEQLELELEVAGLVSQGDEVALGHVVETVAKLEGGEAPTLGTFGAGLESMGDHHDAAGDHAKAAAFYHLAALAYGRAEAAEGSSTGDRVEEIVQELSDALVAMGEIKPPLTLIDWGASWRYDDTGRNHGDAWRVTEFDDSAWAEGLGKFGYGGGNEDTAIDYGGDPYEKRITTYFRKMVEVEDPTEVGDVLLRLPRDDGAVVYLNGVEIARENMPEGQVTFQTLAAAPVSGDAETKDVEIELDDGEVDFLSGKNLIAVEIHQQSRTSSDLRFDLRLSANDRTRDELLKILTLEAVEAYLGSQSFSMLPGSLREGEQD